MDALRRAFNDIALGYSSDTLMGRIVYIKHLNYGDQIQNDAKRDAFFNEAKVQGLDTNEQKIASLIKQGVWSDKKEKELLTSKQQIDDLVEGKKKNMKMPSLVKSYNEMIKKEETLYNERAFAKHQLLGLTCESYADRQLSDYYIYSNLFSDKALSTPFFTESEFDYLNESEMETVTEAYNKSMGVCSEVNIKRLAIQPFFQNYFGLVGDNLGQFFGKPICQLTFFQTRLLNFGAHFRNIYTSHDISKFPKNVMEDPDLLTDYANAAKKGKEEMDKQGAYDQDAIVVGAKKEDAAVLGVKTQTNLAGEIMKSGGNVIEWMKNRQ